jgi:hypothetical protein
VSVDCPYCDGENVVAPVQPGRREVDLTDGEIACKYAEVFSPYLKASRGFAGCPNRNWTSHKVMPRSHPLAGRYKAKD